jgi:penicillin-binding protein 1A
VVKNMLVGNERSIERKARELILAGRLEKQFTKHQILELYMNEIYLGGRSYGVGAAALNYFGKSLSELTLAECAMLAALPQQPARVNPYNHPEAAIERRNWVLERMAINGYVEKAAAEAAKEEKLTTVSRLDTDENQASAYYVEEVRREILRLGKEKKLTGFGNEKEATKAFYEGGLSIRSTLDTQLQLVAQTALQAGLETYDHRKGWRGPITEIDAGDDWKAALTAFEDEERKKPKEQKLSGGAGPGWQLAVVRATGSTVKLGLSDGSDGVLAKEDVFWASGFKRKGGKTGLQKGDVIFVARTGVPDVTSQTLAEYGSRKSASGGTWRIRVVPQISGAVVAMDPHTGRVLAMSGGFSFGKNEFNNVVQAMRQPGSAFKPFVYVAALENGWTPANRVLDAAYVSCDTKDKCYKPSNYTNKFYGERTLRFGIEQSKNAMTVRLAADLGLEKMSEMGNRMGIYDDLKPYKAMSLGAGETTPLRLVTAYASLVNGGKQIQPVLLDRIQDRYGKTVFRSDPRDCSACSGDWKAGAAPPAFPDTRKQLLDPVVAYQMVSILEGTVQHGTASSAKAVGKPLAAKTGTTNDQFDGWTVGFSPDLVVGVWVGFEKPKNMGEGESGGRLASPIFRDVMMGALKNAPALEFRSPSDVRQVQIDADTGCLPTPNSRLVIWEVFRPGTEPDETCTPPVGDQGVAIDLGQVVPGDEFVSAKPEEIASASTGVGLDPTGQSLPPGALPPPPPPTPELTVKEGVF